jgi:hypothetical protein
MKKYLIILTFIILITGFQVKNGYGQSSTSFTYQGIWINSGTPANGNSDIAIWRPTGANGAKWWLERSSNGQVFATQFGANTDKAVPGDYTGDGKADIAFWRPSNGNWFILRSENLTFFAFPFGANGDVPAPADFDSDGRFDAAVFRPSNTNWFINRSTAGVLIPKISK